MTMSQRIGAASALFAALVLAACRSSQTHGNAALEPSADPRTAPFRPPARFAAHPAEVARSFVAPPTPSVDRPRTLMLRGGEIDTTRAAIGLPAIEPSDRARLMLVQFAEPPTEALLTELSRTGEGGVRLVTPLPIDGYLVLATPEAQRALVDWSAKRAELKYLGAYLPIHSVAPELALQARLVDSADPEVMVTIQVFDHPGAPESLGKIKATATRVDREPYRVLNFWNTQVRLPLSAVANLATLSDVVNIEANHVPQMLDERQGMILAAQLTSDQAAPSAAGYREWLATRGLGKPQGFLVDVTDDGLDRGSTDASMLHPDFLDDAGASRVGYSVRVVGTNILNTPPTSRDCGGHGTLNASIIAGRGAPLSWVSIDPLGFSLGLGITPNGRLGCSRVFTPGWTFPDFSTLLHHAAEKGARVSNNSWGVVEGSGAYDFMSQEYDALVRISRAGQPPSRGGMVIAFAAGNSGPRAGTISDAGAAAKNTICVGATEGYRPTGERDGCGLGDAQADNASELISFSSRGPCADGRFKPDLVAPGSHIQGAASQASCFTGLSICGSQNNDFDPPADDACYPLGQKLYTWSSGTSHSCPAVSGAAALLLEKLDARGGPPPSPALVKAWLMNSATFLGFGDKPPSNLQGMGRVNLDRAFDDMPRAVIDQSRRFRQTGQSYAMIAAITDGSKPTRITLAWTDAPGTPIASRALMNDLDLQVTAAGGVYYGNNFSGEYSALGGSADHVNNVETVVLPPGVFNPIYITVTATSLIADGVPGASGRIDQDFALVAYNIMDLHPTPPPPEQ